MDLISSTKTKFQIIPLSGSNPQHSCESSMHFQSSYQDSSLNLVLYVFFFFKFLDFLFLVSSLFLALVRKIYCRSDNHPHQKKGNSQVRWKSFKIMSPPPPTTFFLKIFPSTYCFFWWGCLYGNHIL